MKGFTICLTCLFGGILVRGLYGFIENDAAIILFQLETGTKQ